MWFERFLHAAQHSWGFGWSFLIYHGLPFHYSALRRIYAPLIQPGDLCFDIGSHLGDRVRIWSKLGARVIALEPHPRMMNWLRRWYGHASNIMLVEQAVGAHAGTASLWMSRLTPSVSTISAEWLGIVRQSRRFRGVRWDEPVSVTVTTLDALIRQYGRPVFCKLDVEGAELDVLQGLSQPIRALSFEFIPAAIQMALSCVDRLEKLGHYEYNWRVSEFPQLRSPDWLRPEEMAETLARMPKGANSGDVYARWKA